MSIKKLTIRVDEDLHRALKFIALEDDTSLQQMFIETIENRYLDRIIEIEKKRK